MNISGSKKRFHKFEQINRKRSPKLAFSIHKTGQTLTF